MVDKVRARKQIDKQWFYHLGKKTSTMWNLIKTEKINKKSLLWFFDVISVTKRCQFVLSLKLRKEISYNSISLDNISD